MATNTYKENTMALKPEAKQAIMAEFKLHESDSGSPEVQVALISKRIKDITEHRLLDYLTKVDINRYRTIIKALGIRK
jgi:small subunit ribosomal protein S15